MSNNINVQRTALAWLDDSINDPQANIIIEQQLRLLDRSFKMLKSKNEWEEYLKSQPTDARITLIINGRLGQQIVPEIHSLPQIIIIYVYCMNKEAHKQWAINYNKVRDVLTESDDLIQLLRPIHTKNSRSIVKEVSATDPSQITTIKTQPTYALDGIYMISDSCFDYFVRMKILPTEKDEFVSLCQQTLQGNDKLLAIVQELQESYSADRAISWLYRDSFFQEFIDNMFNLAAVDKMFSCRLFIRDIQKQLEQHKCTSPIQVYRSEQMSDEQFQLLKDFNGKIIAMKSFFLTNLDREKALSYTSKYSSSKEYKRILFIIEANPQIENVKPCAKIGSLGYENDPNDVLFMIGSLFKIIEIEDEKDGIIIIKMILSANDDVNTSKTLCDRVKYQYMDVNGETDVIGLGQFLSDIGNSIRDKNISEIGEKFIRSCLDKLPNDHPDLTRCHDALGNIDSYKGDLDSSLVWYKKSFDIKKEKLQANDLNLAESYKNLASVYLQKEDLTQALEYFKELLIIWKQTYGDDYINLIFCYTNMAMIYDTGENLTEAISYYYQALAVMVRHTSIDKISFAAVYNNLGNAHTRLEDYHLALGYYNTSLKIKLNMCTPINPSIASTYKNIGLVHGYMDNIQQSRENLEKAADIYRQLYSPENSFVTDIEELIRNLPSIDQS